MTFAIDIYEGHFRKRSTVSGEYQVKLAKMLRVMHPAKNWSQYVFFSLSVLASGLMDMFACMQAATAPSQISFLQLSPAGDACVGAPDAAPRQQNKTAEMIVCVSNFIWTSSKGAASARTAQDCFGPASPLSTTRNSFLAHQVIPYAYRLWRVARS
jgi:hypothetical protein